MIKANQEVVDKLLVQTGDSNYMTSDLRKMAENLNCNTEITNYAVSCGGQLVAFCGTDIIHADNVCSELRKIFPDKEFEISEEFLSIY